MTIVVTGASGFLGRRVLACRNARDDEVVGVSIDDDAIATIRAREPERRDPPRRGEPGPG